MVGQALASLRRRRPVRRCAASLGALDVLDHVGKHIQDAATRYARGSVPAALESAVPRLLRQQAIKLREEEVLLTALHALLLLVPQLRGHVLRRDGGRCGMRWTSHRWGHGVFLPECDDANPLIPRPDRRTSDQLRSVVKQV
jgi:hypothetical protein